MNFPELVEEQLKEMKEILKLTKAQTDTLRKVAERQYAKSLVEPGEAVGVVTAQSLGEPGTQLTLRTKWLSGATEMTVTQGLPRLIEIFDARSKPSTPAMNIYVKQSYATSEEKVAELAIRIREVDVESILQDINVDLEKMRVEVKLDSEKMKKFGIRENKVYETLSDEFKTAKITTGSFFVAVKPKGEEEEIDIKALYKLKVKIKALLVGGVEGITQVLPVKVGNDWVIKTAGSNLRKVLEMNEVDIEKTTTNDIFEVFSVLGVEAARNTIIEETLSVLKNQAISVDVRHIMLVSDVMTSDGMIRGIGRYGVSGEKSSVLARASFEVPLKHLFNAAMGGETDTLQSVVENVMVNQPVPIGTGLVNLKVEKAEKGDKK